MKKSLQSAQNKQNLLVKDYEAFIQNKIKHNTSLWVPKTLCIASQYPFFDIFE